MINDRFAPSSVRVRAPATSANLGPGFDAFGLALALYDQVEARITEGGIRVEVEGEGAGEVPDDEAHLVVRAMLHAFEAIGERPPGLYVRCVNRIPHARGLGSSAAAIVSGVLAARALVVEGDGRLDDDDVLRLAAGLEGHPDNVAACLLGGFTIAWSDAGGPHAVALEPHPDVRPVVFLPAERGLTAEARAVLPDRVPHGDAVLTAGRAGLLVYALTTAPGLLYPATEDRLHQGYRAPEMPRTAALLAQLRSAGVAALVSGAGPSVLALAQEGQDLSGIPGHEFRVMALAVDLRGAYVDG